jgi:hypothetical protein
MTATPLGILLSFIGLLFEREKKPALAGLGIAGVLVLLFFLTTFCA